MLQCSSCGSNLRPTARICIKCGHAVSDEERNQSLEQDNAASTFTAAPPVYSVSPAQSSTTLGATQSEGNEGPVFSSPIGEIISSPVIAQQNGTFGSSATPATPNGSSKWLKIITAAVIGLVLVIIFVSGLSSIVGKKESPPSPVAMVAAPVATSNSPVVESVIEQKAANVIDVKNIRPVLAPAQTSGLLTDMLLNNSNSVKLLEFKAKIEETYPKPERGDRKTARALNEQALLAFRQENYQQAVSLFAEALKSDPSDIEVLNNYAYALLKGGRYGDSERVLGFVLSIAPGRTSGWANLADVYANTGRPDAASAAFVVGFRFATNQDKALAFLKDRAETEPNENIRQAVINALAQLSQ